MQQSSKRHTNATIKQKTHQRNYQAKDTLNATINHMTAGTNVTKIKSSETTNVTKNHNESLNVTINHTHSVH